MEITTGDGVQRLYAKARQWLSRPEHAFVAVALTAGAIFVVLVPPIQAPDELSHFFRAYQVSTGQVVATTYHNEGMPVTTGGPLPESMKQVGYQLQQAGWQVEGNGVEISPRWLLSLFKVPLEPEKMATAQFAGGSVYSPIPYIPQSAGMLVARTFKVPPIAFIYIGRLCNLLAYVALVYLAVRLMPFAKWGLIAIALLPTTLTQAASLSGDAITNSLAFLALAYFLYLYTSKGLLTWRQLAPLASIVILLTLTKSAFIVFALLPFLLQSTRFSSARFRWLLASGILLTALILATIWSAIVSDFLNQAIASMKPWITISPPDQLRYILTHPLHFIHTLASTFFGMNGSSMLKSFVGTQYPVPLSMVAISYATLACVWLGDKRPLIAPRLRLWLAAMAAAGILAVSASLYFIYNAVGSAAIEGLNGRYFIPLAPVIMLVVMAGDWRLRISRHRVQLYVLGVAIPLIGVMAKISNYFFGLHV